MRLRAAPFASASRLEPRLRRRLAAGTALGLALSLSGLGAAAEQRQVSWQGAGAGAWSQTDRWTGLPGGALFPNNLASGGSTYAVTIDTAFGAVTLDVDTTIDRLVIGADDTLEIAEDSVLTLLQQDFAIDDTATLENNGTLSLLGTLVFGQSGGVYTIEGEGDIEMAPSGAIVAGVEGVTIVVGGAQSILAAGRIGGVAGFSNPLLRNDGLIQSSSEGVTITVDSPAPDVAGFVNNGRLVSSAGTMTIVGSFENVGSGEVLATEGGLVDLSQATVTNLDSDGRLSGGLWVAGEDPNAEIGSVINFGGTRTIVENAAELALAGNRSQILAGGSNILDTLQANAGPGVLFLLGEDAETSSFTLGQTFTNDGTVGLAEATLRMGTGRTFNNAENGFVRGTGFVDTVVQNDGTVAAGNPFEGDEEIDPDSLFALTVRGVQGDGTLRVGPQSELRLLTDSSAGNLVMESGRGLEGVQERQGVLRLETESGSPVTLTIGEDFFHDDFSANQGDSFDHRRFVIGGPINRAGDNELVVGGDDVLLEDRPALRVGDVHVRDERSVDGGTYTRTSQFTVKNDGTTGPTLRGAVQRATDDSVLLSFRNQDGNIDQSFGSEGLSLGETITFDVEVEARQAGRLTGGINVVDNFDNTDNTTLALSGAAFNLARELGLGAPRNLGAFRVGQTASTSFEVANIAPDVEGFTEGLRVNISDIFVPSDTTVSVTGPSGLVQVGKPGAIDVTLQNESGGRFTTSFVASYASDGTGINSLGVTDLGTSDAGKVTASFYRLAQASVQATIDFGNVIVGSSQTRTIRVANLALDDGFSDVLNAAIGGVTGAGFSAAGVINGLAAGAEDDTSLVVTLDTSTAGSRTGSVTVTLVSDGTSVGLGTVQLDPATVGLFGVVATVGNRAAASVAPTAVNLGNLRVGDEAFRTVTVTNTAEGPREGLDSAIDAISGAALARVSGSEAGVGSTVTTGLGQGTSTVVSSTVLQVGLDTSQAGARSGSVTLGLTSDGSFASGVTQELADQTVTVAGSVFRTAVAPVSLGPINLGAFHEGDAASRALSLTNGAAADGFSEGLNIGSASTVGSATVVNGLTGPIAAGGTNATDVRVGIDTSTAGARSGTAILQFTSDGAGTSGLTAIDLGGPVAVDVTGEVYRLAATNTGDRTVTLTNRREGGPAATGTLTVTNTAGATGGFTETLGFQISGGGDSGTGIGAGNSGTADFTVAIPATAGAYSTTRTITYTSEEINDSGLGDTSLGSATVTLQGSVYRLAEAAVSGSVEFGNVLVGSTQTRTIRVANIAASDGFSDLLNAAIGAVTGTGFSATGSVTGLAAGSFNDASLVVTLDTSTAGSRTGSVTVTLVSDGTAVGLGTVDLPSANVALSGNIEVGGTVGNLAQASYSPTNLALGNVREGTEAFGTVTISNIAEGPREGLTVDIAGITGSARARVEGEAAGAGANVVTGLGQGTGANPSSTALQVGVDTSTAGARSGTVSLVGESDGSFNGGTTTELGGQDIQVSANVYKLAQASLTETIVLGNAHEGDAVTSRAVAVTNSAANTGGFTEGLGFGSVSGASGFSVVGNIDTPIAQGASQTDALLVTLNTTTAGSRNGQLSLTFTSDGEGTSGLAALDLAPVVVDVTGAVYRLARAGLSDDEVVLVARRGGAASGTVTITNTAGDTGGFTETLGYDIDRLGISVAGLVAGESASLTFSADTATSGETEETYTVAFRSDEINESGLGTTDLESQDLTVTTRVYETAVAEREAPTTINFIARRGDTAPTRTIAVTNGATGALTDDLTVQTTGVGAPFFSERAALRIAAGESDDLVLGVNTASSGLFSGSANIVYSSVNPELDDLSLGTDTVQLNARINEVASVILESDGLLTGGGTVYDLDFGSFVVGSGGGLGNELTLRNGAQGTATDLLAFTWDLGSGSLFNPTGFADNLAGITNLAGVTYQLFFNATGLGIGEYQRTLVLSARSIFDGLEPITLDPVTVRLRARVVADGGEEPPPTDVPVPAPILLMLAAGGALLLRRRRG